MKQCFKNSLRDIKTLPGADIDSDHNLLVAEVQTRLKAIKNPGRMKQKWNLQRIKSKENYMKGEIEQKFSQIDWFTASIEDRWGKAKETLPDILNNDIGKMEIAPRKLWTTQAMNNKMEERRKVTKNFKEYIKGSIIYWKEKLTELKKYIWNRYVRKLWAFRKKTDMFSCIKRHIN